MNRMALCVGVAGALVLGLAPVAARPVSANSQPADPNRIVCINEDTIGTRLSVTRVCRTAAEWVDYRRQIRDTVDRVQANKSYQEIQGSGFTTGSPQ